MGQERGEDSSASGTGAETGAGSAEIVRGDPAGGTGRSRRWWIPAVGAVLILVAAFAILRPDKLVTDQRVDEQLDSSVAAVIDAGDPTTTAPTATTAPSPAPSTSTPTVRELGRGTFVGQAGHRVEGSAIIVERPEGRLLVLPELDAENGPDLQLYLSPGSDGSVEGGVYLEPLKGNQGTQTYDIPADVDLSQLTNVVIWCERFSTPFGTATLST